MKRLVIQRTKMVDETQELLLNLLEDLTSGTAEETQQFIRICVETVKRLVGLKLNQTILIVHSQALIAYLIFRTKNII